LCSRILLIPTLPHSFPLVSNGDSDVEADGSLGLPDGTAFPPTHIAADRRPHRATHKTAHWPTDHSTYQTSHSATYGAAYRATYEAAYKTTYNAAD